MADRDMLGINENTVGTAKLDRKDSNGNKLGNIVRQVEFVDASGVKRVWAEFMHPTDTLTTLAQVQALGLKHYAAGTRLITPSGTITKTGASGVDTWSIITGTALA